jgi:hypothetical protein
VLQVGDQLPDATVFASPGEAVRLSELPRPFLLLFFLFDWSST